MWETLTRVLFPLPLLSKSLLPLFSSRSLMVAGITFESILSLFLYMVQ